MNSGEETALSYRRIPFNESRRNKGSRKSPLEHHCNNHYRQDPQMDPKISGQKFEEKQDICNVSKYPPLPRYLLITKKKIVTLQKRHAADTTLTK